MRIEPIQLMTIIISLTAIVISLLTIIQRGH